MAGVKRFQYLNAICLYILARHFLVHETPQVGLIILQVVNNLGREIPIIIILAETLNGLDVVPKGEATFFTGNPFLLQIQSLTFD